MQIPFVKDLHFTYGEAAEVAPGVRRVIAENPGPYTYTGSGTYLIGTRNIAIIDPGPDLDSHIEALMRACNDAAVTHIFVTHTHSDHCGGARKLAQAVNAKLYGYSAHPVRDKEIDAPALDEGADYQYAPDVAIGDGDVFESDEWRIEAVHTPGHLSNHLCFALTGEKILFTGDHMMGWATTVVAPPDGDMTAYLESLDKLLARDDALYLPTHGAPITKPRQFTRAVKAHRLMRDSQILDRLKKGDSDIKQITAALYASVDKRLHKAAALNVFAHLIRLIEIGTVTTPGEVTLNSEFHLADAG